MLGVNAGVALAYILTALVKGQLFEPVPVWPAAGVALAAAALVGDRAWLGVALGSLLSSLLGALAHGVPLLTVSTLGAGVHVAAGHALATVVAARALRWSLGTRNAFESPLDTLRFCVWGACTYACVSFLVGDITGQPSSPPGTAFDRIGADLVGAVVVAPMILVWVRRPALHLRRAEFAEAVAVLMMALGVMAVLYSPLYRSIPPGLPAAALLAFPLFWAAMRLDQRICLSLTAVCCMVAWSATARGHGALVEVAGPVAALARAARSLGILTILLLIVSAMYTERTLTEAALRDSEARLQEANRQKDEFLAMLAHELRNPLAPIRNAVQILRLIDPTDQRIARARDMIDRQVTHLVRLVDDLLDISRVTRGKILLRKERVDLSAMVHQAVEAARPLMDRKGQTLTLTLWAEPIEVDADPARLIQVITNLLTNAAKFTAELGQIALHTERAGEFAVIRVQDTGVGIAPELLTRVFDLFVQGNTSLDRAEGGLGIGLPLVHRLVEMHGGHVSARSAGIGHGSEFIVTWPALPPSPPAASAAPAALPQSSCPLRILVVDDNLDTTESLVNLLELAGHEVRSAATGLAALDLAQLFLPDIAFIDIGLPGVDGYQVARRLRQQAAFQTTLLVAVSGYGKDEDKRHAHEAGFDLHLTKPVDPSVIGALLAEHAARATARSPSGSLRC